MYSPQEENENFVTLTEQGNFGLGVGKITKEEERKQLQERLNEMQKSSRSEHLRNSI